jgi:fumarate reductase subunit D
MHVWHNKPSTYPAYSAVTNLLHEFNTCVVVLRSLQMNLFLWNAIQINHQPYATVFQFIILTFIYSSTCFGCFSVHHQELNVCSGSLWFYLRIVVTVVLCSWSGRPRTQHGYHHDTKVKPEAATADIELLMMGGKTPETCWAVNKRQDNKLENCCIWLGIYLNCTMRHGLSNLKFMKRSFLFCLELSVSITVGVNGHRLTYSCTRWTEILIHNVTMSMNRTFNWEVGIDYG